MTRTNRTGCMIIAFLLCGAAPALAQTAPSTPEHVPLQKTIGQAGPDIVPSLIVMNARGASRQGGKLTLTGVAPNSIVFADRPVRAAGHPLTTHLFEEWSPGNESDESFTKDPPGADKRREFFYWTDDGNLAGLRYLQWKAAFLEQRGLNVWAEPLTQLRLPRIFNLRSDPFERSQHESGDYVRWFIDHAFLLVPAQAIVAQHIASFRDFPPRQRPGSFSVEQAMEKLRLQPSTN
jgi:hypothetical protein